MSDHADGWLGELLGGAAPEDGGYGSFVAGTWPSTSTTYAVTSADGAARVDVTLALRAGAYQPDASEPASAAGDRARKDRRRLATAYRQLTATGVTAALLTSLQQAPDTEPAPLPVDVEVLRRYLLGAYALLGTVAGLADATASADSLDALCASHGIDVEALANANADAPLGELLGGATLQVPVTAVFDGTVRALCEPHPGLDPVAVLLDPDNVGLPLAPGVELTTPPRTETVPDPAPPAVELASLWHCTLARLVAANADVPGLLAPTFVFVSGADLVPVETGTTLADIGSDVVVANAGRPGMFRDGVVLAVDGYVAQPGETLAANDSGFAAGDLAPLNTTTPGLYAGATPLFLTTVATDVPPDATLAAFAAANATTPAKLLRRNGSVAVSSAVIPGTWAWPEDPASLLLPYTVAAGDSLDSIAARSLGSDAGQLAATNAAMAGCIAAGVTVEVGGARVTTTAAASLDELCALFDPPVGVDELVDAIATRTDVLAPGALLACPPRVLRADDAHEPTTALLEANAGTPGLLVPGATLALATTTETVAEHDTLTAVVERFRRRGTPATVGELVAANAATTFLRPGALALVPPAAVVVSGAVGTFPAPVFRIHVSLAISQDTNTALTPAEPAKAIARQLRGTFPALRAAYGRESVWGVVFGPGGVTKVGVGSPARTYAIRPLSTSLARADVDLADLDPRTGTLGPARRATYQAVDLDGWAPGFLGDADELLTDPDVTAALAEAVVAGLHEMPAAPDAPRAEAVATLRRRLLRSLRAGYETTAAVQYETDVESPWQEPCARLAGTGDSLLPLAGGRGVVTVLVDLPGLAAAEGVDLALDYRADALEYDTDEGPVSLAFAEPPPVTVATGSARVPVVLRTHPSTPLLDHAAVPRTEPRTLDDALRWDYAFAVRQQLAAQDRLALTVTFDEPTPVSAAPPAGTGDGLLAALARCIHVAPQLRALLADPGTAPVRDAALATYAALAGDVARAWAAHWSRQPPAPASPAPESHDFELRVVAGTVTLTREETAELDWPDLHLVDDGGTRHELSPGAEPGATVRTYPMPGPVSGTFELTFRDLHVARRRSAIARVRLTRNASAPAGFGYRIDAGLPAPAVPAVEVTDTIEIGAWSEGTLQAVFDAVFGDDPEGRDVTVDVGYELPVGGLLPVLRSAPAPYHPATTAAVVTAAVDAWRAEVRPDTEGAAFVLGVTAGGPAVRLRRLVSPLPPP